jgi:hypothetical protein
VSLQTRLTDFVAAVGADIKGLRNSQQHNFSTANQTVSGNSDTLLAGSVVDIPQGKVKVGTKYKLKFNAVKTAAGTATPVLNIRVGTAGAVGDASRATLTFAAQTAVIDEGVFEIEVGFRSVGAGTAAILSALGVIGHRLATTGLSTSNNSVIHALSAAGFDSTLAALKISASLNVGASASWTINLVSAELVNLTP